MAQGIARGDAEILARRRFPREKLLGASGKPSAAMAAWKRLASAQHGETCGSRRAATGLRAAPSPAGLSLGGPPTPTPFFSLPS